MDQRRLELQTILESLAATEEEPGAKVRVYYQPTSNILLEYPCIVYQRAGSSTRYAGNNPYLRTKRYTVTVIEKDVNSDLPDRVADLPMCSHSTFFVADKLNHDVFDLYF